MPPFSCPLPSLQSGGLLFDGTSKNGLILGWSGLEERKKEKYAKNSMVPLSRSRRNSAFEAVPAMGDDGRWKFHAGMTNLGGPEEATQNPKS